MIRSFVLFTHIVGILFFFAGLGLEWAQRHWPEAARQDDVLRSGLSSLKARLYPMAGSLIVLSGVELATTEGLWSFGWIWLTLLTIVVIVIAEHRLGAASLYFRSAVFLGVVYLMIGKPDLVPSLAIMVLAALIGGGLTLGQSRVVASPQALPHRER